MELKGRQPGMNVTVYCGSSFGDKKSYTQAAHELGIWIASKGHGLVYGGGAVGLMGIVAKAALDGGAEVIGVEPRFFLEAGVPQHELTQLVLVDTMSERKAIMIERGDAFVALPGGMGTLEEISEIMSRIRLRLTAAPCILLNIDGFYDELERFLDKLTAAGFVDSYERNATFFARSVQEAVDIIENWKLDHDAFAHPESMHA